MSTRQLNIDLSERVPDAIALIDESVVYTDRPEHYRGNHDQENQE